MVSEQPQARRGLVDRILGSWLGPRAEMRRLLADRPSEATFLSFLMFAALFGFMGGYIDHAAQKWDPMDPKFVAAWEETYRAAHEGDEKGAAAPAKPVPELSAEERRKALRLAMDDKLLRDRVEMAIGAFLVFPLGLYLLAAAAHPLLRATGGQGDGYETRAAFIWASVTTAPLGLGAQLLIAFGGLEGSLRSAVGLAVLTALLAFVALCLAEAHRFRSAASILGGLAGVIVLAGAAAMAVRAVFF